MRRLLLQFIGEQLSRLGEAISQMQQAISYMHGSFASQLNDMQKTHQSAKKDNDFIVCFPLWNTLL